MLKPRPGTNTHFSTCQPLILPPKPPSQLLTFSTFQYLYTHGSRVETVPNPNPNLMAQTAHLLYFLVFIHGSRVETVPNLMASAALELKPSLTQTLWPSATYC